MISRDTRSTTNLLLSKSLLGIFSLLLRSPLLIASYNALFFFFPVCLIEKLLMSCLFFFFLSPFALFFFFSFAIFFFLSFAIFFFPCFAISFFLCFAISILPSCAISSFFLCLLSCPIICSNLTSFLFLCLWRGSSLGCFFKMNSLGRRDTSPKRSSRWLRWDRLFNGSFLARHFYEYTRYENATDRKKNEEELRPQKE